MSNENTYSEASDEEDGPDRIGMLVSSLILMLCLVLWGVKASTGAYWAEIGLLISQVALISVIIWQACDPFADAAQWIGDRFQLPGSVRGATLDAVASSMPELFSGIFFVVVAIAAVEGGVPEDRVTAGSEGYGSTIATCAGSAVYNMILIPAFCGLVIAFSRKSRPTIDVEDEVISRDGMWFVGCEMLLILFLFQNTMHWWMGIVFLCLYAVYIFQLYRDAGTYRKKVSAIRQYVAEHGTDVGVGNIMDAMAQAGWKVSRELVMTTLAEIRDELADRDGNEAEETESAGIFFGLFSVSLNPATVFLVLSLSTLVAAGACYFLVEVTLETAKLLAVPTFFVAVVLAAAASSVPDTFLAIGAARRGDDSGAVSNAFGSNIFDICVCLSIPLLVNSYLTGWQPVALLQDGRPIAGLVGLRILLVVLTVLTLAIMWHNRQLTFRKSLVLCALYGVFLAYAVLGSLGVLF
ncbi:hypothetical protein AB1L42_14620 [Thalassoglobus sp. JC818]|uniref:sodium:calcium antiporter n=1 Tax=Thalassoglobus sp. JC818 TaxID=3232136 RepID=UPI003457DEA5